MPLTTALLPNNGNGHVGGGGTSSTTTTTLSGHHPLTNILHPGENDILCGRGGATNAHPGNIKFRKLVAAHKLRYLAATKCDKPSVAKDVVREWRAMIPPGRFLAKMTDSSNSNSNSNSSSPEYWYDVGDKKAREKASQCLRERNGAANEVVANLVRAVTAAGEECPEDYATLIHKASAVIQAQQQQQQQQQQDGDTANLSLANGEDELMFRTHPQQQQGMGKGRHRGKKSSSPGVGNHNNNNDNYHDSRENGTTPPTSTEDDLIEAELQRLLKMKQHQNNDNISHHHHHQYNITGTNTNIIGGGAFHSGGYAGVGSGAILSNSNNNNNGSDDTMPTPYMGEESVMREYENLMRKQREIDRMRGALQDVATTSRGVGGGVAGAAAGICGLVGNNDNIFAMMGNDRGMMHQYSNSGMVGGRGGTMTSNMMMHGQGGGVHNLFNTMNSNMNNTNMMLGNNSMSNTINNNNNNNNDNDNSYMRGFTGENNNSNMGNLTFGAGPTGRNMSSLGNHIPDAAKDYINRLRMLRQEGGREGGNDGMKNAMTPFPSAGGPHGYSVHGSTRDSTMLNMGGFGGNDINNNLGRKPRELGTGGGGSGEQFEFVEEYQASLKNFLSHNGDFGVDNDINGKRSSSDFRKASRQFSETTHLAGGNSSSAEQQPQQGGQKLDAITCIQIPTNLEDGHGSYNKRGGGGNRRPSRDDSYLPTLRRNTFGSMDSFSRPSFQSFDDIDMRDSFKSVNTMDMMSIGCSINEVYDEDVKINSENWKKYRRRMSAASQVDHTNFGASHLTGLTGLTDYGSLSRPDEGGGFGVTSHIVQTKDCDGPSKNTRGSQMSMVLNLDDPENGMRLSFASVLSELSDFKE